MARTKKVRAQTLDAAASRVDPMGAALSDFFVGFDPYAEQKKETPEEAELRKCSADPRYFVRHYCQIYDATSGAWIPFELWPDQESTLDAIHHNRLVVILKARQLGLTWLCLAYALWLMLFRPIDTVILFSRREEEAKHLIGQERMMGMYSRLPEWMRSTEGRTTAAANTTMWRLNNGSNCKAFPTNVGDSYTASFVLADEFDIVEDQDKLLRAVKPTTDGGGKMVLLSRVDKARPETAFKRIYRAAKRKLNAWIPVFLPWNVRPERTQEWYEEMRADSLARTGAYDDVAEQYPQTDDEALMGRTLDKRIPPQWIEACTAELQGLAVQTGSFQIPPALPGLTIYEYPNPGNLYVLGADPSEGNPTSDPSSITVLNAETLEEVACLNGNYEPPVFADYIATLSMFYHNAPALIERNNHGFAVILWLQDHMGETVKLLWGQDNKPGWYNISPVHKAALWTSAADDFRALKPRIHSYETKAQLQSIMGDTLKAPEGWHDDRAISFVLALRGAKVFASYASPAAVMESMYGEFGDGNLQDYAYPSPYPEYPYSGALDESTYRFGIGT